MESPPTARYVCSWCGADFEPGDWTSSDCCSCDPVPFESLPGLLKDARREAQEAIDHAIADEERYRKALVQAIEVIEWCGLNDRSQPYKYGEPRKDGTLPGEGKCFNTPREFANYWPDVLREALDG